MILAQITTDPAVSSDALSVWALTLKGGPIMIPIAIASFVAVYIFFERLSTINKANKNPDTFIGQIKDLVQRADINGARLLCSQFDTPIARMIEKGVARIGSPLKTIEASVENVAKIELFKLEKNLSVLATVAG